jgi:hypothetical protein
MFETHLVGFEKGLEVKKYPQAGWVRLGWIKFFMFLIWIISISNN